LEEYFGSVLLEYLGASVKWVLFRFFHLFKKSPPPSFKDILDRKSSGTPEGFLIGLSNILIGAIMIVLLTYTIILLA